MFKYVKNSLSKSLKTRIIIFLKAYLKRNGIKQNAFFLDCIRQALAEDTGTAEE